MGLIFDGVDLEERFGLMIDGGGTWTKPERDRELVHVPGRNGDLIFDNGCWNNVDITYRFLIKDGWQDKFEEFARWICRHRGYFMLEDPERHPDCYRMAEFADSIDPSLWFTTRTGVFELTFNCKPQQFLYEGETPIQVLVPVTIAGTVSSNYIPTAKDKKVKFTPVIDPTVTGTVTGKVVEYNSSKTQVATSSTYTLTNGTAVNYTITSSSAAFWRIIIDFNASNDVEKIGARVIADTTIDGNAYPINAYLGRRITFENPTGYKTKPIYKFFGEAWLGSVASYGDDGEIDDSFSWNVSDFSSKSSYAIMDCELQYMYYEYTNTLGATAKGNLGAYLFLTQAESAAGQALSFPEYGEGKIVITNYRGAAGEKEILEIYPRWWRI